MEMATGDWGKNMRKMRMVMKMKSPFYHAGARELRIVVGNGSGQGTLSPIEIVLRSVRDNYIRHYMSAVCLVYVG